MTTATPAPVLQVEDVVKRFAGVTALDGVSFSLQPGQAHALIGENGAGKSTLIKVMTGVHQPDAGRVRHHGAPVRFADPAAAQAAGIATIYQEINLIPLMSAARNLFLGREPRTRLGLVDLRRMNAEAEELLGRYGVRVDPRTPLRELGIAVQQMVAVARAVSSRASVVIMDEPTSSLEPREVERLFTVVRALKDDGVGVVYVSHKLDEVFAICDSITVLRDGRHVHTGPAAEMDRHQLVALMLGRTVEEVVAGTGVHQHTAPSAEGGRPVLEVRSLTRRRLLHDVSFDVRPGEIVGLAGLLGSGRSETVKAVFGAQTLDSGEVHVAGDQVRPLSPAAALRSGVALLPEDRKAEGVIPDLSISDNIVLAALPRLTRAGVVSRSRQAELVEVFMRRLRIKATGPGQKVRELSGGNQQKVLLARLLCIEPRVLLLDEPTRGIDVGAKAEVRGLVEELARTGLGVVLISSELEEVAEGADRVVVLQEGRTVGTLEGSVLTEGQIMAVIAGSHAEQTEAAS